MWISHLTARELFELDELYWFIQRKGKGETRENIYTCTMISREPRQIVGFSAAADKSPERIQARGFTETFGSVLKLPYFHDVL